MLAVETEQPIGDAHRWRTRDHGRDWIARMDRDEGTRDEELWTLVSFLTFDTNSAIRILELGAGHGLLSRMVLEQFPHTQILALDLNPAMIEEGQRRLAAFGSRIAIASGTSQDLHGRSAPIERSMQSSRLWHCIT
jgi:predicted O-methyltransferase YrrM